MAGPLNSKKNSEQRAKSHRAAAANSLLYAGLEERQQDQSYGQKRGLQSVAANPEDQGHGRPGAQHHFGGGDGANGAREGLARESDILGPGGNAQVAGQRIVDASQGREG